MSIDRVTASLALVAALAAPARADDKPAATDHYNKGATALAGEKFPEAAQEFQAGYQALPDPTFLYDLGQAYRAANQPEKALAAYQEYLRLVPNAANRAKVEGHLGKLKEQLGTLPGADPPEKVLGFPIVMPKPPPPSPPRWPIPLVGAAVVVVGAVVAILAVALRPVEPSGVVMVP
jgi:tetratricopeptide (TPR) repeat protein